MRIAFFTDTFIPQINGIATAAANLAEGLGKAGHKVIVLVPTQDDMKRKMFRKKNVRVVYLPSVPVLVYPEIRLEIFGFAQVFSELKEFKPDLIHVHTPGTVGLDALLASYIFKVPLVGTVHTFFTQEEHTQWISNAILHKAFAGTLTKYYRSFYESCDYLFCPSKLLLDELEQHALKSPVYHVPNAIAAHEKTKKLSVSERKSLKKKYGLKEKVIIHFGRLSGEKNVEDVLRTFALLSQKRDDLSLLIIGDGPLRTSLNKLAITLGIADNVIFTGFIDHTTLLSSHMLEIGDLFVTASVTENQPMVVLEAMSFGLPVVGVKQAGMIEMIKNNGYLVPVGDLKVMASKLRAILDSTELQATLSKHAIESAKQYDITHVVDRTVGYYNTFIKQGKRAQLFPMYDKQVAMLRYNSEKIERMFNDLKLSIVNAYNEMIGK